MDKKTAGRLSGKSAAWLISGCVLQTTCIHAAWSQAAPQPEEVVVTGSRIARGSDIGVSNRTGHGSASAVARTRRVPYNQG